MSKTQKRASVETPDRRVIRTRQLLQEALFRLMLEQGFDRIRVQDIVDQANLGRATFYLHYDDKLALLDAGIDKLRRELEQRVRDNGRGGPLPGLRALFEHAEEHPTPYLALLTNFGDLDRIRSTLAAGLQVRLEEPGTKEYIPSRAISAYLAGALLAWLEWWLRAEMPFPVARVERMFLNLAEHGVPADFGPDPPPDRSGRSQDWRAW